MLTKIEPLWLQPRSHSGGSRWGWDTRSRIWQPHHRESRSQLGTGIGLVGWPHPWMYTDRSGLSAQCFDKGRSLIGAEKYSAQERLGQATVYDILELMSRVSTC